MTRACVHVLVAAMVASCTPPGPKAGPPAPHVDSELLRTLAVLATRHAPSTSEVDMARHRIESGALTMAGYVDQLVASHEFESEIAPLIILRHVIGQNALAAPGGFVLHHTETTPEIYYLDKPCAARDAVAVRPWWTLIEGRDDTILICPDSYLPDKWLADVAKGEPETACLSVYAASEPHGCGCGPSLMRCYRSDAHLTEVADSLRAELRDSVAYSVANSRPLAEIFTSNETVRDRNAELVLRRWTAESEQRALPESSLRELASWPTKGTRAPRPDLAPGEHAGILTSPHIVHFTFDRRQRMTAIYDVLYCVDPDSVGATPETLLSIKGADLQIKSDGWRDLAGRPICTNCHARLDFGFQFFWGFANANFQSFFVPQLQQTGRGPLYVHDIHDPRGEAELTPHGFASLAVAQPEFRRCMARDFAEYVFGNRVTSAQIDALATAPAPSARELMRAALLAYAATWTAPTAVVSPTDAPPARRDPAAPIVVTKPLRQQLETYCLDCHEHEPGRPDLATAQLDRRVVVAMLEQTAFGNMPKDQPLPEADRARFLESLIDLAWVGEDAVAARHFFIDRWTALPAYRPEVAFELIHDAAGGHGAASWRMMESAVHSNLQQLTPGMLSATGLEAIATCRAAHTDRTERARCIADAVRLQNLSGRASR
jgi:hypothetical protein